MGHVIRTRRDDKPTVKLEFLTINSNQGAVFGYTQLLRHAWQGQENAKPLHTYIIVQDKKNFCLPSTLCYWLISRLLLCPAFHSAHEIKCRLLPLITLLHIHLYSLPEGPDLAP